MSSVALKIRVLIVDDIAETRENVRKLLAFENDVEVVGLAGTGREGTEVQIDVVLDDETLSSILRESAAEAPPRSRIGGRLYWSGIRRRRLCTVRGNFSD